MQAWTSKEIRDLRSQVNMTQEELAQKLGVTTSTVNRWENSKSIPSRLATASLDRLRPRNVDGLVG